MNKRLEIQMYDPIRNLMRGQMGLSVISEEFSSGYGIADLVGAAICKQNYKKRKALGVQNPLDKTALLEVLILLSGSSRHSFNFISKRISFSEITLTKKVLPEMEMLGLIEINNNFVKLLISPPPPTKKIVAIEAKQKKWREAILQARRYTFFADQSYIAVWNETAVAVDRRLLYRHRLGLIGVSEEKAQIILEAPMRAPRQPKMNRYCSEYLYRKILGNAAQE